MTSYIINEDVEFIYEENRLTSLKNEENVTLTTPSSKCLYLLIENSPHVVSHDELLKRVWEDNGMIVPVNTLHQSISIIRRGLNKVQPDSGSLVKNIPGQGFKFTGAVTGNNKDNKELCPVSVEKTVIELRAFSVKYKHFIRRLVVTGVALLGFISTAFIHWSMNQKAYTLNLYKDYLLNTTTDGCSVYSNARVKYDIQKKNEIHKDMNGYGLTCTDYPMEYISTYTASSVSSAIKCKISIYKKAHNNCISFYYRDGT